MALRWDRDRDRKGGEEQPIKSPQGQDQVMEGQDGSVLLLRTNGNLLETRAPMNMRIALNGLVRVIRNYPNRKKEWAFSSTCSNLRTGEIAVADTRGQVFVLSASENVYRSVRLASSPVSCIGFVTSRPNELIVAYENGVALVIDTQKKEIIGNLQQIGSSPIRMIRAHPSKPSAILVSDERVVFFWNLSKMRCFKSFECDEPIVDIRFEASGALTAMALQDSGLLLYRTADFALLQRCPLPAAERRPDRWLAYASHSLVVPATPREDVPHPGPPNKHAVVEQDFQMRVWLSADNGMIYVWDAVIAKTAIHGSDDVHERPASLVGVVELPVTMRKAVALISLAHVRYSAHQARVLALSDIGDLVLIEVQEASAVSLGTWAVTIAMGAEMLFGPGAQGKELSALTVGGQEATAKIGNDMSHCHNLSHSQARGEGQFDGHELAEPSRGSFNSLLSASGSLFLAVGVDSAARLFDADCALGLGELSGTVLRCRAPHTALAKRPDYWSQIQDMKASHAKKAAPASAAAAAKKSYASLQQASGEAKPSASTTFPWSAAARQGLRFSTESNLSSGEDLGPPPPYMSQSLTSANMASMLQGVPPPYVGGSSLGSGSSESDLSSSNKQSAAAVKAAVASSGAASASAALSQPTAGGDSPKGPSRRAKGPTEPSSASTLASAGGAGSRPQNSERELQREMDRQQRTRDAKSAAEEEALEAARQADLAVRRSAIEAARGAREAERAKRAQAKAAAAAERREAKLKRQEMMRLEGISQRASELFQLAALSPAERDANVKKLRGFLEVHGEFPGKYRNLIWRFLLQLPENAGAFNDLRGKGVHSVFLHLAHQYPLHDSAVAERLQKLCSQLAHWSPVLSEATFLPQLVFPFVVQFAQDELCAFESAATLMMWWGHTWMTSFPGPPIHIIDAIDALVAQHDSKLRYHFSKVQGLSAGQLGWAMMSTAFSEVLCRSDWLKFMDFLFAHFRHPGYFLLAPVAVLRNVRPSLVATERAEVLSLFCQRLQGIDVSEVIADIKSMFHATAPTKLAVLVPRRLTESGEVQHFTTDNTDNDKGKNKNKNKDQRDGASDDLTDDDEEDQSDYGDEGVRQMRALESEEAAELEREGGVRDAMKKGSAVFPLPKGAQYPAYDCYPAHVLDWQLRERAHENSLNRELHRKENILRALTNKTTEVRAEHENWMSRHGHAADAEARRRVATMEAEIAHMKELLKMEELISTQRVEALTMLEKMAGEELTVLDSATEQAKTLITASENHLQQKADLAMNMAKHRELAEEAEATTEDRMRTLHLRRTRDERLKALSSAIKVKEQDLDARDALLADQWRREDEEAARRRLDRANKAKELLEDEVLGGLHEEMSARMRRLVLEREAKLVEVERARALRLAKERTDEAIEAAERSALLMQKQELAAATEKAAQLAAAGHKMTQDMLMTTADQIRTESQRLVEAERVYALRQNKARLGAQAAGMEREWAEKQTRLMVGVLSSEQELQEQRLRMARASAETEAEEALILEQQRVLSELQGTGSGAALEALGERVMSQQRARFEEMRKNLSDPRMQAQGIMATLDSIDPTDTSRRAAERQVMTGDSLQAILKDKKERHERERRVAELLNKNYGGTAAPEGIKEGIIKEPLDEDPTLWSFR